MRRRFVVISFCIAALIIIANSYFNPVRSNLNGAPSGKTGSPRDGSNCTSCHKPPRTAFTGAGSITSNIPAAGYTAGQTYTITAAITRPGHVRIGFEVSPQDTTAAGNILGTVTVTNTTTTKLAATGYITHTSSGVTATNGSIAWSFSWTAPASGKGPVVFYGAFNATNDDGHDTGDSAFLVSAEFYEAVCTIPVTPGAIAGSNSICAGDTGTYFITAIAGATSYIWTLPNGWTGTSSTNSIFVTAGTAGGSITVKASNSCGTSPASTQTLTISSAVTPAITISTPQNTICSGTAATFTATPANGGTTPTYQWLLNGNPVGNNSSSYTNSSLINGDIVTCKLTTSLSCVTSTTATSSGITMTVNATITPTITITASDTSFCQGANVTFNASAVNGGTIPGYQWLKNGSNITNATLSSYNSTTLADGDVIAIRLSSTASCASPQTVLSNSYTMHVTPLVTPVVSIASNSGNSICANQTVTFTSTESGGGVNPAYQWYDNGNLINGATSSSYTTSTLTSGDAISLSITSNAACASPQGANSNTISFTIITNGLPSVTVVSDANDSICAGQLVTFNAVPINGGNSPAYQWLVNGNALTGDTASTYSTQYLADGDTVEVQMLSNSTCVTSNQALSSPVVITVLPAVIASIDITPSADSICSGQSVSFSSSQQNGGPGATYQWYKNGQSVTGANASDFSSDSLSNGDIIEVSMTSSVACASPAQVGSNTIIMAVTPTVVPAISISSNNGLGVCEGTLAAFTAAATNQGNAPDYQWEKNGINVGANQATYTDAGLVNGDAITCMLTSSAICATPTTANSNSVSLTVITPAAGSITAINDSLVASAGFSYQWYLNNTLLAGDTSQVLVPAIIGNYMVMVTDANGCQSSANDTITTISGIAIMQSGKAISIYPNPTDGILNVSFNELSGAEIQLSVNDVSGKLLFERKGINNSTVLSVDVSTLPTGIYLLQLSGKGMRQYYKFVVSK